ncbi:MAG: hypothetical protein BWX70_00078 [Verrucomicrobia bacterium ADurb.Bin070]|nr:MAG: hypothetical protein BWX70_00078 [Verrucomicrobia bacterium ADurb.Bin070]
MLKIREKTVPLKRKRLDRRCARHLPFFFISVTLFAAGRSGAQQEAWAVPGAALRVDVTVSREPDHPDLGVFVKIPNGGLLPGKFRIPDVRDAQGKQLESLIVADSQTDGFGVLFAKPGDGETATVYITPSASAPPRPASTRLFPATFFFSKNGNASLEVAKRMERDYPPAQGASFDEWDYGIGSMVNPFGPDDDFSTWIVGAFFLEKKERIYFCTISDEGSEFAINGKTVHSWPGIHTRQGGAKGQRGDWVELGPGLHRIDYYHFEKTGPQEINLCWKRPGMETKDGLPEHVSGLAQSGRADIKRIAFKDGRVAGVIRGNTQRLGYYWIGEKPLVLFALSYGAVTPSDTQSVTWEFPPNKRFAEPAIDWLVSGDPDTISYPVTLAVSNAAGLARTTVHMRCFWTPPALSLDTKSDRLTVRKALYDMLRAVPQPADPCADWSNDHWGMLIELLEPYNAGPILIELFNRGFDTLQKRPAEERWVLEDRFIETLRLQRKDKLLLDWIARLEKNERTSARKFRWKDERVCAYLFDINNPAAAKREVVFLKETAIAPDQTQLAALRQGDVERALGNYDAAMKFYKDAQDRFRSRNKVGMAGGRLTYVGARKRRDAEPETNTTAKASSKRPAMQSLASRMKVDDWKVYTVHDASMYATITSFLAQDALPEAFQKLTDWENESPASKLSGDYPMAEARVYLSVGDLRRAVNALATYRKSVTMSAQLADAMKLEIECLQQLNDKTRIKEIAADFVQRFPGHPYEAAMKEVLAP